ncbi:hypothetical protein E8E14_001776 [Neopestalotiopsis sp. 37M]|nr:hypothetical protein E8E14_001776 [Neopestalotiopsis sp. 37M]
MSSPAIDERALVALISPLANPNIQWADLLMNPRTRTGALRSIIARTVMARIDPRGDHSVTLLPPGCVDCLKNFNPKQNQQHMADLEDAWRCLTAKLYSGSRVSITSDDPRAQRVRETAIELNRTLHQFRNQRPNDRSQKMLEGVIEEGALFGFKIFAQTEPIAVDWGRETGRSLVVFPGFQQSMKTGTRATASVVQVTNPSYAEA